jgi:5'-nucleotidase
MPNVLCSAFVTSPVHPERRPKAGVEGSAVLLLLLASCATAPKPVAPSGPVEVQILAFNDFHGALEATPLPDKKPGGGAALLAGELNALRTANSITVSAGDLIGGSPLPSGFFHDEGAIEVMNAMGLGIAGIGNHELDEGSGELLRMQRGGCHPTDGCQVSQPFPGAKFEYLAANVIERSTGKTLFPPTAIRELGGVKVGFIGMTLKGTPRATVASMVKNLDFKDEVETANALVPGLIAAGAKAVVVLIHEGGFQGEYGKGTVDGCENFVGPIIGITKAFDPHIVAVVSGHTHSFYNCVVEGRPVTSAGSRGQAVTDLRLQFDASGSFTGASAHNFQVDETVKPDPAVAAVVQKYLDKARPIGARQIGTLTAPLDRKGSPGGDSPLGNVVTDAMLAAAKAAPANAEIALMNTSGLRADLTPGAGGAVTYSQAFEVQPFGNVLLTVSVTGAELEQMLEMSVAGKGKHLEVSGLSFTWNPSAPAGERIDPKDITVGGKPLDLARSYRAITNSILSDPISGYAALAAHRDEAPGPLDLDAFSAWLTAHPNLAPPPQRVQIKKP